MYLTSPEVIVPLSFYLFKDPKSLIYLSSISKEARCNLKEAKDKLLNEIPWRIKIEYHFRKSELEVHEIKVEIYSSECTPCEYCSSKNWFPVHDIACSLGKNIDGNKEILSSRNIRTTTLTGNGIKELIKEDYVGLWFSLNYTKKTMIPINIGIEKIKIKINRKTPMYYDETQIHINFDGNKGEFSESKLKRICNTYDTSLGKAKIFKSISPKHLLDNSLDYFSSSETENGEHKFVTSRKRSKFV